MIEWNGPRLACGTPMSGSRKRRVDPAPTWEAKVSLKSGIFPDRWQVAAAALALAAGWIHVFVAPEHLEEWVGYGAFFVLVSVLQMGFALLLLVRTPPRSQLLWAGVLGNAAIVALWVITRTAGIPLFGPAAGEVEVVGALDIVSKLAELGLIACLVVMLRAVPAEMNRRLIAE